MIKWIRWSTLLLLLLAEVVPAFSQKSYGQSAEIYTISEIKIKGNKKTKQAIIERELDFSVFESLDLSTLNSKLEKSKSNLQNTSLFNFVIIKYSLNPNNDVRIDIELVERWYIWPQASVRYQDRNLTHWLTSKDWSRIYYGGGLTHNNFGGRNQKLAINFVAGYFQRFNIHLSNLHLDKNYRHSMNVYAEYNRQHSLAYNIENNAETSVKLDDEYAYYNKKIEVRYNFRQRLNISHSFAADYNIISIHDTIQQLNPKFLNNNDLTANYLNFQYSFQFENRNMAAYPTKGNYFRFWLVATENWLLKTSDYNYQIYTFDYRHYFPLTNRFFTGTKLYGSFSSGNKTADLYMRALGYDASLRGFDHYIIEGQHYGVFQNNLKFNVVPTKTTTLKFVPSEKFSKIHFAMYANLNFDLGYAYFPYNNSPYSNQLLYSYGGSLDFVTYYDKILRLDLMNSPVTGGWVFSVSAKVAF